MLRWYQNVWRLTKPVLPGPTKPSLQLTPKTPAIVAPSTTTFHILLPLHAFLVIHLYNYAKQFSSGKFITYVRQLYTTFLFVKRPHLREMAMLTITWHHCLQLHIKFFTFIIMFSVSLSCGLENYFVHSQLSLFCPLHGHFTATHLYKFSTANNCLK
jgi:hypothetical protein